MVKLQVPDCPIIPFIEGDGTGPDIWRASVRVFDAAVARPTAASGRSTGRRCSPVRRPSTGEELAARRDRRGLPRLSRGHQGPLTTPIGGGIRSLNVALRQMFDLYVCLRPVRWFKGVPSPVKAPEKVDMVIFRENTEDIYAGIEFEAGSEAHKKFRSFSSRSSRRRTPRSAFPRRSAHRHQAGVAGRHRAAVDAAMSTRWRTSARASRSCTKATS